MLFYVHSELNQTIIESLDIMEEMESSYNDPDYVNPFYENISPKIIVDNQSKKSIQNGIFHLPELITALKIAKDGDLIFIKSGTHIIEDKLELLKSVKIVGNGPGKTKIKGAFNIKSNVQFENLSLEITKGTYCLKI